jgi:hypothetical protein
MITSDPLFTYVPITDPQFKKNQKVILVSSDGSGARRKGIVIGRARIDDYVSYEIRLEKFEFTKNKEQYNGYSGNTKFFK